MMFTAQLGTVLSKLGNIELAFLAPANVAHSFTGRLGTSLSWPENVVPGFGALPLQEESFQLRMSISVP